MNTLQNCKLSDYTRQISQIQYIQAIVLYEDDGQNNLKSFQWNHDNKTYVVRVPSITGEFARRFMAYARDQKSLQGIRCRMNDIGQTPYLELAGKNETGFSEPYAIRGLLDFVTDYSPDEDDDTVPIWRLALMGK